MSPGSARIVFYEIFKLPPITRKRLSKISLWACLALRRNSGAGFFHPCSRKAGTFVVGRYFSKPKRGMSPSFAGSELQLTSTTLFNNPEREIWSSTLDRDFKPGREAVPKRVPQSRSRFPSTGSVCILGCRVKVKTTNVHCNKSCCPLVVTDYDAFPVDQRTWRPS